MKYRDFTIERYGNHYIVQYSLNNEKFEWHEDTVEDAKREIDKFHEDEAQHWRDVLEGKYDDK